MKKIAFAFDRVTHYQKAFFLELENRMRLRGIEVHVFSGTRPPGATGRVGLTEKIVENEHKYKLREHKIRGFGFNLSAGFLPALKRIKPSVVVCQAHVGNVAHWTLALRKNRLGFRLVSWLCGYEPHPGRIKNALLKKYIPRFDHHLAYHSNARQYALSHGVRPEQVTVMHNTIDESRITIVSKEAALATVRRRHQEIGERKIVLYVGSLLHDKRVELIIDAMDALDGCDAVLVVVGAGPHLPLLKQYASGSPAVVFAGEVLDGVGVYFDAAEVLVMPGTGGLALNEAMAHSRPIICGAADGSADDLVLHGQNGLRLSEGTAEEIALHLRSILTNPGLGQQMGRLGREWIVGKFSFRSFVDRIEGCLLEQLGSGK